MATIRELIAKADTSVREILAAVAGVTGTSDLDAVLEALDLQAHEAGVPAGLDGGYDALLHALARQLDLSDIEQLRRPELEFAILRSLASDIWERLSAEQQAGLEQSLSQRIAHITDGRMAGPTATMRGILDGRPSPFGQVVLATAVLGVLLWTQEIAVPLTVYRNAASVARRLQKLPDEVFVGLWSEAELDRPPWAVLVPALTLISSLGAVHLLETTRALDPGGAINRTPEEIAETLHEMASQAPAMVRVGEGVPRSTRKYLRAKRVLRPDEQVLFLYFNGRILNADGTVVALTDQRLLKLESGTVKVALGYRDIRAVRYEGHQIIIPERLHLETIHGETVTITIRREAAARFFQTCLERVCRTVHAPA